MKNVYLVRAVKLCLLTVVLACTGTYANAQLSGTFTISPTYPTIASFVADLNAQGVGAGGVNFVVPSGYAETAPAGGYVITATGTSTDQIAIGAATAPQPIITASPSLVAGSLNDAIFKILGGNYITIANLDLRENAANTITAAATNNMTEWGIAVLYNTTSDGSQNCSLIGNTIMLNRTYQNTFGIYANATHSNALVTTSASAIAGGGNNALSILGNVISNVNMGIVVIGATSAADFNDGVNIGGTGGQESNTITNFGTTGTFSGFANVSGTVNGILVRNSKNVNISYNTITSSIGGTIAGTLNGIQMPSFSVAPTGTFTQTVTNNTISLQHGLITGAMNGISLGATSASTTSTLVINNNNFANFDHATATGSGAIIFITNSGTHSNQSISNNTFTNINVKTTGSVTFISNSHSLPTGGTKNVNNNSILTAFQKTGAGGTVTLFTDNGSDPAGAINNSNFNNFSNITVTGATVIAGWGNTNGGSPTKTVTGNIFNNWIGGSSNVTALSVSFSGSSVVSSNVVSNISGGAQVVGLNSGSGTETFTNNEVFNLSSTGPNGVVGISNTGGTTKIIERNKIYGLSVNNAGGFVNGILSSSGTSVTVINNVISGLSAPASSGTTPLVGISVSGGTNFAAYYNSVYLSGTSSGANFGSSAISVSTTPNVTLTNNIFINECTAVGTGIAVAYRRSGTTLTSYNAASNRNLFFAGTPSATRLIMYDGTNSYQTLAAYQTAMVTRDANSITGEAFTYGTPGSYFISLTGSSSNFLRPVAGIVTQSESGAINITSPLITADYASVIRAGNVGYTGAGTAPDMGAYEFAGVTPAPVVALNSVTPPASPACAVSSRSISMNITTTSGTVTGANLIYAYNGTAQTPIALVNTAGSTWTVTLPAATPVNASVTWSIVATNSLGLSSTYIGTAYADEPLLGATASASATNMVVCAGSPSTLSAVLLKPATITVGATGANSSNFPDVPLNHVYGGSKTQYIYRASELIAAGLSAGNITSLSYNVTTVGTTPMNAFSINMGHTAQTVAIANTAITAGLTPVYSNAAQTLTLGTNTYTFSTPFVWDGVSNIVVSFVYSNNNAGGTSTTITSNTASFVSTMGIRADNTTGACLLGATTQGDACVNTTSTNATSSIRPLLSFAGNSSPAISSVTWMNAATMVGTGNPLTVNPTATTTYTANITASGCVFAPAPTVMVTVNPLPSAPTAVNSAQCGTQVPTATVTSTSGLPTPTFVWYDLATGGTVQQSDVSTSYLSNVAATTTFYVSELNVATGCESPRTPVTVTVALADGISASTSLATICIGGSVTLTAANTNPTPNQVYAYSWDGTAGSGVGTAVSGSSISATPTAPGTYSYALTGVDGGCAAAASVTVTVNPFVASVTAVNITCNGYNNGSFTLSSTSCGTAPYQYDVDGGGFVTTIPTNLAPGAHSVIVRDANMYVSSLLNFTITQPSTTISAPTTTAASICLGAPTANVLATSSTNQPTPQTVTLNFGLTAQPLEVSGGSTFPTIAVTPNIISSATMAALPAGAVITSATLNMPGLTALGNSWQSDLGLGLSGAVSSPYASGTGAANASGAFSYTLPITPASINVAGGTVNLHYYDKYDDNAGAESTFPIGPTAGTLVINYTVPTPATISWWAVPSAGTTIGSGSPFNAVGTSVLPNTNTAGTYTLYAQGEFGGCSGLSRTPVTVTVNAPSTSSTTISNCTNYTWSNGTTYTASGTYTQTLTNAAGCDSVATLNLTIIPPTTSTTTISNCANYTWTNGTTYTASGSYTQTLTNAAGCDSVATLALTILAPTTSTTTISNCANYTWTNGTTYTASGSYTQTLTNAAGCDSVATLALTILAPTASTTTISNCVNYTWTNGTMYTASGMYTQTLTNAAGCDSIATLNLTINAPTSSAVTAAACGSYTWSLTGATYTASGTQTATLVNAAGCDSIVTLTLTINPLPTATAVDNGDATITSGSTTGNQWINCATGAPIAGATNETFVATANGSYAVVVTNANGCSDTSACVLIDNVGVKDITADNVSVFPNPATDKVTITFTSPEATTELVDAQGKVVSVSTITSGASISLTDCEIGVYYIRLTTENGTTVHKLVKQ